MASSSLEQLLGAVLGDTGAPEAEGISEPMSITTRSAKVSSGGEVGEVFV
jgi:hypothetical protein